MEGKSKVIENIINWSLDSTNFANPIRVKMNTVLEIMFAYTNINFTDKQKEDRLGLYDLIVSSGLWKAISDKIKETEEYDIIINTT